LSAGFAQKAAQDEIRLQQQSEGKGKQIEQENVPNKLQLDFDSLPENLSNRLKVKNWMIEGYYQPKISSKLGGKTY
jgi:hypothetical protein